MRARTPRFDVDLATTLPRSAQGHPVIFQAGDPSDGRDFAPAIAGQVWGLDLGALRRGVYPAGYAGRTLREHLELRPPLTRRG